jgi:hypothetical protein
MMTVYSALLAYFILSSLVAAWLSCEEYEGWRRFFYVLLVSTFGPLIVVAGIAVNTWEWLESHAQAKTFWYFLFNRKRMRRTAEELDLMHRVTVQHKTGGNMAHRLWRLAERCYFIVNDHHPPVA